MTTHTIAEHRAAIARTWQNEARRSEGEGMHILAETCRTFAAQATAGELDPPMYHDASQYSLAIPQ